MSEEPHPEIKGPSLSSRFETAFNTLYKDRRIFRTRSRNLLGTGPFTVEKGDIVVLVAGLDVPYIFRPVNGSDCDEKERRSPTLVGQAYVHYAIQ